MDRLFSIITTSHLKKRLILLFAILATTAFAIHKNDDPDYYIHAASGRYIMEHGIPTTYPFAFTYHAKWRDHEWLAQVVIYGFERVMGTKWGTFLYTLLFLLLAVIFALNAAWEAGKEIRAGPLLLFLVLLPGASFIEPRPHLIAIALAAALLWMLERVKNGRKTAWFVFLLIPVVWVNSHGSFPVAAVMAAAFLTSPVKKIRKKFAVILLIILGGYIINPYHFHVFAVPFEHLKNTFPDPEWAPWSMGKSPLPDLSFILLFLAAGLPFVRRDIRKFLPEFLVTIFYLLLAAKAWRFTFSAAILVVPLALGIARRRRWLELIAVIGAISGTMFFLLTIPPEKRGIGLDKRDFPIQAVQVCKNLPKKGKIRVFNPLYTGGYIEYAGYPRLSVTIDGQVYVAGFQKTIKWYLNVLGSPSKIEKELNYLRVDCVIVDSTKPGFFGMIAAMSRSVDFNLVHIDDHFGVYVRKGLEPKKTHIFKVLRPISSPGYLFKLPETATGQARAEAESIKKNAPVYANLTLGVLALRGCVKNLSPMQLSEKRDCGQRALPYFEKLVGLRPSTPMFQYLLSGTFALQGQAKKALDTLKNCQDYLGCKGLKILIQRRSK